MNVTEVGYVQCDFLLLIGRNLHDHIFINRLE